MSAINCMHNFTCMCVDPYKTLNLIAQPVEDHIYLESHQRSLGIPELFNSSMSYAFLICSQLSTTFIAGSSDTGFIPNT